MMDHVCFARTLHNTFIVELRMCVFISVSLPGRKYALMCCKRNLKIIATTTENKKENEMKHFVDFIAGTNAGKIRYKNTESI